MGLLPRRRARAPLVKYREVRGLGSAPPESIRVRPQPLGITFTVQLSRGEGHRCEDSLRLGASQHEPVQLEEHTGCSQRCPLVPVMEGMVATERVRIGRCEIMYVDLGVCMMILWAGKRGLEQSMIADADEPTMLHDQLLVDREHGGGGQPSRRPLHRPSSRSAFR